MGVITLTQRELDKIKDFKIGYYKTEAGILKVFYNYLGVFQAYFEDNIKLENNFLSNKDIKNLILIGTKFQNDVWKATLEIPAGTISSYSELAKKIFKPTAYRAVANALANNKILYFIPCHRVLKKNKELCGYNGGIERKEKLLMAERYLRD